MVKNYFMDLMYPERMEEYHELLAKNVSEELDKQQGEFELFDLANRVVFHSISEWSGINLEQFN